MKFISYFSSLLSFFKDKRIIDNIEKLIQKMIEKKTVRLFNVTDDFSAYNRCKALLDGSLKSILDDKKISHACWSNSVEAMSGQKQVILVHDPCDIRKKHAKKLENLGKVRHEDKKVINGYSTFNTVAINENL